MGGEIILGGFPVPCASFNSTHMQEIFIKGGSLPIGVFEEQAALESFS